MSRGPLAGIRVLDLSRVLAGPWCAQMLGDLGADVVKVEQPGQGDDARQLGPALAAAEAGARDSMFFLACNRNKRSIAVDLAHPEGAALVRQLAAEADVLVENFKAGGLRKYGLDADTLRAENPRLIYCSVTGFGQDGPYAPRPAYDFVMQALSGLMSTCGQAEGAPTRTAIPATDLVTGFNATIAVLAALMHRTQTGDGQFIDAAMLDASVAFNVHLAQDYLVHARVPGRQGNSNPVASPSDVFATADGWMVVAAGNDRQFVSLCTALERPDLAHDPRFTSNALRIEARTTLNQAIGAALGQRSTAHWLRTLEVHQVPCAPIHDMDGVFNDPQVRHRALTVEVAHGSGHRIPLLRSPLNLSAFTPTYRAPPQLGEHTGEVLRDWLGAQSSDEDQLRARRAVA